MKRPEPIREMLPVTPKPGAEVVYKRFSRLPQGAIVCTVSYLESKKPIPEPARKKTFLLKVAGIWSKIRGTVWARLRRLKANKIVY